MMQQPSRSFADYKEEGHLWITLAKGQYYPDYLKDACNLSLSASSGNVRTARTNLSFI